MSDDERRTAASSADADPLEEQTQPLFETRDASPESADAADLDTTVVMQAQAPPALQDPLEEQATVVLPAEEPPSESEPDSSADAEVEAEETDRIQGEVEVEVEVDVEVESAPDFAATAETIVSAAASATAATLVAELSTKSQIAPSSSLHPLLLERIEPSLGRGERIRLDASHWRVSLGRGEQNDLRLYTASASREHAVIAGNESGEWVLTPFEDKAVAVDGEPTTEPVVLEVGMNLVMGGDHLRCVTEGLDRAGMTAQTSADFANEDGPGLLARAAGIGLSWWLISGVALLGIGLIAMAWFGG